MRTRVLTLGILAFAAVSFATLAAPRAWAQQIPAKTTYKIYCARCHGFNGNGDGPDAATLSTRPRDFADCAVMQKISDATIIKAITDGGGAVGISREMPSWGAALSSKQIKSLAAYVRTFCHKK